MQNENGTEPSAPITKKGILTSFKTGKPMNIPDNDIVSVFLDLFVLDNIYFEVMFSLFSKSFVFLFQLGRCRFVSEFEKLNRIGEGTYGIVCEYFNIR